MVRRSLAVVPALAAWCFMGSVSAEPQAAGPLAPGAAAAELSVTSDFEGGSGRVRGIDQDKRIIRVEPSGSPKLGWPCWWYFKVEGIRAGETIGVELDASGLRRADGTALWPDWAIPARAAFSTDNRAWGLTQPGERAGPRMLYRHKIDAKEAWFAWGPPLGPTDAAELVRQAARKCPHAEAFELCRSLGARAVPALRVCEPGAGDDDRLGVWVNARQHAWECGSSWVCKGLIDWLVSQDPRAQALRKKALVTLVPVMDVDSVAAGAGGKQQEPHDHNRDWSDRPFFPAVEAAQREIRKLDQAGRFDLFIDLHNPGQGVLEPLFNTPYRERYTPQGWGNVQRFLAAARAEMTGPMTFKGRLGQTGPHYDPKSWQFMAEHWVNRQTARHVVSVALETPNNTQYSTGDGYAAFGRQLGLAIERYLRVNPRRAGTR